MESLADLDCIDCGVVSVNPDWLGIYRFVHGGLSQSRPQFCLNCAFLKTAEWPLDNLEGLLQSPFFTSSYGQASEQMEMEWESSSQTKYESNIDARVFEGESALKDAMDYVRRCRFDTVGHLHVTGMSKRLTLEIMDLPSKITIKPPTPIPPVLSRPHVLNDSPSSSSETSLNAPPEESNRILRTIKKSMRKKRFVIVFVLFLVFGISMAIAEFVSVVAIVCIYVIGFIVGGAVIAKLLSSLLDNFNLPRKSLFLVSIAVAAFFFFAILFFLSHDQIYESHWQWKDILPEKVRTRTTLFTFSLYALPLIFSCGTWLCIWAWEEESKKSKTAKR